METKKFLSACAAALLLAAGCAGCLRKTPPDLLRIEEGGWFGRIATDKAVYAPGSEVHFTLQLKNEAEGATLLLQFKHLGETIREETIKIPPGAGQQVRWSWTPPKNDFQGYLVDAMLKKDGKAVDHTSIAVDVSSDWGKFPRYGYLADFAGMDVDKQEAVIDRLNRFHLNGLQFYDWQWKHHQPLKTDNGRPAESWKDIANRGVSFETVKGYIDLAHARGMKAMNYNLLFGAYKDAAQDGVKREWGLFKDPLHMDQDYHPLPSGWASSLYLMNPSSPEWQDYVIKAEKQAFEALPFDGWHVDQLGDRGSVYDYSGNKILLDQTYGPFLKAAKEKLNVDLVMNAVSQFGQPSIAQAPVKFLYTEVWGSMPKYKHLKDIVDQNAKLSQNRLNTVLAAYMNYDLASQPGEFNAPGVLLTDAVIFASGGSHIELGESMLGKEYFPNRNLRVTPALEQQLIRYYDFLTAYQNVLRDGVQESDTNVTAGAGLQLSKTPEQGKVWMIAKRKDNLELVHLINFTDANSLDWRDLKGTQSEPSLKEHIPLAIQVPSGRKVKGVWTASPDVHGGSPIRLAFKQEGGVLTFTIPQLKYWDMAVMEYE